jgi:hypothetical protein
LEMRTAGPTRGDRPMTTAEKNAHYGFLNQRFDVRAAELIRRGFKYERIPTLDIAVFLRPRPGRSVPTTLAASLVLNADPLVWQDTLDSVGQTSLDVIRGV